MLGPKFLVPTFGVYRSVEEIPLNDLPDSFVLKVIHVSDSTVIVTGKRGLGGRLRD